MICRPCSSLSRTIRKLTPERFNPACEGTERIHAFVCSRCGAALSSLDYVDELLAKLAQLNRCGLGDAGTPLLELAGGADRPRFE